MRQAVSTNAGAGTKAYRTNVVSSPSSNTTSMEATVSLQRQQQQHHYPPSTTDGQYPEAYRPAGQSSLSPPLHSYTEAQPVMQQPQHYAAAPTNSINGASMPHPPPYNPPPGHFQYRNNNGAMQPAPMPSNGHGGVMRYPIAQAPELSGVRGKKEIKRRTKSGCLTCRKRRIKVRGCISDIQERCVDVNGAQWWSKQSRFARVA